MKKLILAAVVTATFATPVMAQKFELTGWDGFTPEPVVIKDNLMDDDATGQSTGDGGARVSTFKKPNLAINNDINDINCDNERFAGLCAELDGEMKAHALAKSIKDRAYAVEVAVAAKVKAMKHADVIANNAKINAINYANGQGENMTQRINDNYLSLQDHVDGISGVITANINTSMTSVKKDIDWVRSSAKTNTDASIRYLNSKTATHASNMKTDGKNYAYSKLNSAAYKK